MESHFHNQKGSSGALPLHNHNTPTLHKQSQSLWSETQVHKTLRTMKGALERCSDTAQATITTWDWTIPQLQKLAFKIVHSSMILLPAWKEGLVKLRLNVWIMPCDMTTRWNSTYNMLKFAVKYWEAVEEFTSERKNELHEHELTVDKWDIVIELCSKLKVCTTPS